MYSQVLLFSNFQQKRNNFCLVFSFVAIHRNAAVTHTKFNKRSKWFKFKVKSSAAATATTIALPITAIKNQQQKNQS